MAELTDILNSKEIHTQKIGTIDDYFEIEADGTIVNHGTSTTFDDISTSLIGARLHSAVGKVDFNYDESSVTFQPGGNITNENDRVLMNIQTSHSQKLDSMIYPHLHYKQSDTTTRIFTLQYRIQNNGSACESTWVTLTANSDTDLAFPYVSGDLCQIISFSEIDMTGYGISAIIQFRLTRTDNNSGDIEGNFFDCHFEKDTTGSRQQYIK